VAVAPNLRNILMLIWLSGSD